MEGEGAGPGRRSAPQPPPRQCAVAHTGPARSTSRHQGASRKQPGDGLCQRRFHRTPPRHGQVPALRSQNLPCESVRPDRACAEGRPPHQGGQMLRLASAQPPDSDPGQEPTPGTTHTQEPLPVPQPSPAKNSPFPCDKAKDRDSELLIQGHTAHRARAGLQLNAHCLTPSYT